MNVEGEDAGSAAGNVQYSMLNFQERSDEY
jgi:hypothetical protein